MDGARARGPASRRDAAPALSAPITALKGVGPSLESKLARIGIRRVSDLLFHLPLRYEDRTRVVPLGNLPREGDCLTEGMVVESRIGYGRRRSWLVLLEDDTGALTLRFFHFTRRQQAAVQLGFHVRCFGRVRWGPGGPEMVHPEYHVHASAPPPATPLLAPVYPATEGLGQNRLRVLVSSARPALAALPRAGIDAHVADDGFRELAQALEFLHAPPADATPEQLESAADRVALDELVAHALVMRERRILRGRERTTPLPRAQQLGRKLLERLGFELTGAQRRVTREVLLDLEREEPMLRLLQGDVGSGKTVVAAFAAIRAAEHGCQSAVMAPTEILAEQHYLNFAEWLEPLGITVGLLTASTPAADRRRRLAEIRSGECRVAVGTHALFQQRVEFGSLALAIIDEQHRFGVHERLALRSKGRLPHQLVMTATPIPRTLAMAFYADMDVSVIDELPPGRQPITTRLVSDVRRAEIVERVAHACARGRQAYWVCTLIEDSEDLQARAAETTAAELATELPGVRIGLVHGRLPPAEKGRVMADFKAQQTDLLVATTVIEVGVDVPNATLMVIENPERLGLAQLHQLRGRVGRGAARSHCILLYRAPLGDAGAARLNVLRNTQDGFRIAEEDLKLRGPGDLLGTRQSGALELRVADLGRHAHLLGRAAEIAARLGQEDPAAARAIVETWSVGTAGYPAV